MINVLTSKEDVILGDLGIQELKIPKEGDESDKKLDHYR